MKKDITPEQIAFDFLAREYIELASIFGKAQPAFSAQALSEAELRLNKQFDGLELLFSKSGMEQELKELIGPARGLITAILEELKSKHPNLP